MAQRRVPQTGSRAFPCDDETARRKRWYFFEVYGQILRRDGVRGLDEKPRSCLHQFDGHSLARAAMSLADLAGTLRDELERCRRARDEALGPEDVRIVPDASIMVRPVEIEQDPISCRKIMPTPLEGVFRAAADEGEERVEAANLLHKRQKIALIARPQPCRHGRMLM